MLLESRFSNMYGQIELFLRTPSGDKVLGMKRNRILREGVDAMSQIMAGVRAVDGVYFIYTNSGTVSAAPFDYATKAADLRVAPWTDALNGFTRNALAGNPIYSSSDVAKYNSNRVSFTALASAVPAVPVAGNEVIGGTTRFYAACLVSRGQAIEDDMLYAGVAFEELTGQDNSSLLKQANATVGIRWTLTYETSEV